MEHLKKELEKEARKRTTDRRKQITSFNSTKFINSVNDEYVSTFYVDKAIKERQQDGKIRLNVLYNILIDLLEERILPLQQKIVEKEFFNKVNKL